MHAQIRLVNKLIMLGISEIEIKFFTVCGYDPVYDAYVTPLFLSL